MSQPACLLATTPRLRYNWYRLRHVTCLGALRATASRLSRLGLWTNCYLPLCRTHLLPNGFQLGGKLCIVRIGPQRQSIPMIRGWQIARHTLPAVVNQAQTCSRSYVTSISGFAQGRNLLAIRRCSNRSGTRRLLGGFTGRWLAWRWLPRGCLGSLGYHLWTGKPLFRRWINSYGGERRSLLSGRRGNGRWRFFSLLFRKIAARS